MIELSKRQKENCRKIATKERCKHGMIWEYCAVCQARPYIEEVRFPIEILDNVTGCKKTIFMRTEVQRVRYETYR